jgi:hypothetical protein
MRITLKDKSEELVYHIVIKLDDSAFSLKIPQEQVGKLLVSQNIKVSVESTLTEVSECVLNE